uniref:Uncharacterized protein n=1 Tax=Anguilla anguilla TaxID=7936 RepID=A0A0E9XNM2_ANGAN
MTQTHLWPYKKSANKLLFGWTATAGPTLQTRMSATD